MSIKHLLDSDTKNQDWAQLYCNSLTANTVTTETLAYEDLEVKNDLTVDNDLEVKGLSTLQTKALSINNNQSQSAATKQCRLETRTSSSLTFPVPTVQPPSGSNLPIAFDVCPTTAVDSGTNGLAWVDICDVKCIDDSKPAVSTLRLGMKAASCEIGNRTFDSGVKKPLYFTGNEGVNVMGIGTNAVLTVGPTVTTHATDALSTRTFWIESNLPSIVYYDSNASANNHIAEAYFNSGVYNIAMWRDSLSTNFSNALMIGWQGADPSLTTYAKVEQLRASQTTNQIILGTTNTTTINSVAPSASRVYSVQDAGANCDFVMTAGNQSIAGNKTFTGNIKLNTSGGTQSNLNYYEEYTDASATAIGPFSSPVSISYNITRIGRLCNLQVSTCTGAATASNQITLTTLPVRFQPNGDSVIFPLYVQDNSVVVNGNLRFSSGNPYLYTGTGTGSFTSSGNAGFNCFSVTYYV